MERRSKYLQLLLKIINKKSIEKTIKLLFFSIYKQNQITSQYNKKAFVSNNY